MANINISTNSKQDKAIKFLTDKFNLDTNSKLTPFQYFTDELKTLLDRLVNKAENMQSVSLAEVYNRANPEDQATIDLLRDKYK